MIRKLLLTAIFAIGLASPALAQNTTCSDRPSSDNSNACANTRFVQGHAVNPGNITLPDGQIIVGNGSNVGQGRTMSGDCTLSDIGVITCAGAGTVPNIAALKALAAGASPAVYVDGYFTAGDGGQGWFSWNASSSIVDNSCSVFIPNSAPATGRWVRQIPVQGEFSVAWCGGLPNNTTDIGPIIQNIITNILPTSGGTIILPGATVSGNYYAMATTVTSKNYVKFKGVGPSQTVGANVLVTIQWTGSNVASSVFDLRDTYNNIFDSILVQVPAAFTGSILDIGSTVFATKVSFYAEVRNSSFIGQGAYGSSNVTCIKANRTIEWIVDRNQFTNCKYAIYGRNDPDTQAIQSTTGTISHNQFFKNQIALFGGGNNWTVIYNIFEADHLGRAQAFNSNSLKTIGMYFAYNWMGDVTATGGTWFNINAAIYNFTVQNNYFGGEATGTDVFYAGGAAISGLNISDNYMDTFSVGMFLDTGTTINGGTIQNNTANAVTSCYGGVNGGSTNISRFDNTGFTSGCQLQTFGTTGYHTNPDGIIEQWGTASVTAGTPLAVTFPLAFPSACYNSLLSLISPGAGTNTAFISTPCTTTGMTLNVAGTGASTVNWRVLGR